MNRPNNNIDAKVDTGIANNTNVADNKNRLDRDNTKDVKDNILAEVNKSNSF